MPPPLLYVAYYRVSTQRQGESGLGLEAQRETVAGHIQRAGGQLAGEYTDLLSGRSRRRPQLASALAAAKKAGAVLVVAKLDRLARDAAFLLELAGGSVPLVFCDLPTLGTIDTVVGRLMLTMLAGFAEFESSRIGQRIREAYAAAKRMGRPIKPAVHTRRGRAGYRRYARRRKVEAVAFADRLRTLVGDRSANGMSLASLAEWLNRRGERTREGERWTVGNLWRVLHVR